MFVDIVVFLSIKKDFFINIITEYTALLHDDILLYIPVEYGV